ADSTPTGIAMPTATSSESRASSIVIGSLRATVRTTDSRVRIDSPRSPLAARRTHRRYWMGTGSSSPYLARISARPASSDSVPPREGELLDRVAVERCPLRVITDLARSIEQRVDSLVARVGGVQRAPARVELVDVAVGVHAPAPADEERAQPSRVVVVQSGGE